MPNLHKQHWDQAIHEEISHWENHFSAHPGDIAYRYNLPMDADVLAAVVMSSDGNRTVNVLEVGCGPVSSMGLPYEVGPCVEIVYSDPLAPQYSEMMKRLGHAMPHPILNVAAEKLDWIEGPFHVIFARNSIDHAYSPVRACQQIAAQLVSGGFFVFKHVHRAKTINRGEGLHQWDFFVQDGDLLVEGYGKTSNITQAMGLTTIEIGFFQSNDGVEMIRAVFTKGRRS